MKRKLNTCAAHPRYSRTAADIMNRTVTIFNRTFRVIGLGERARTVVIEEITATGALRKDHLGIGFSQEWPVDSSAFDYIDNRTHPLKPKA